MSDERDNVIHVTFGKDGGAKRQTKEEAAVASMPSEPPPGTSSGRSRSEDPLADLYSVREVARVFGLTPSRLRYWDRSGFLKPSGRSGRRRFYTFQDLIGLRVAKGLLDAGVSLQHVRRAVEGLRTSLPRVIRPLNELRVVADGQSVLVRGEDGAFEPATGQRVLDFEVNALRDDVVRALESKRPSVEHARRAYDLYLEACRLDEDPETTDRAEALYLEALAIDPALSNALTNLGNLRFRAGALDDARAYYEKALAIEPAQPEAHYNLGFLAFEEGEPEIAADRFQRALDHDPAFADAHFNLAMALEELGRFDAARTHWDSYLRLDPSGPWAEVARRHLRRPRA
jgi:DNA-binding transcriptional MerR regulator